ncbi:hypothetical protein D3C80_2167210 [compost metagenome]
MHDVGDFLELQLSHKAQYQNFPIDRIDMHQPAVEATTLLRLRCLFFRRLFQRIETQSIEQTAFASLFAILGNALVIGDAI